MIILHLIFMRFTESFRPKSQFRVLELSRGNSLRACWVTWWNGPRCTKLSWFNAGKLRREINRFERSLPSFDLIGKCVFAFQLV